MAAPIPARPLLVPEFARGGGPLAAGGSATGAIPLGRIAPALVRRPADAPRGLENRRTRIWELAPTLHCSIIGTCLTTADLRALVRKFAVVRDEAPTDHDLHSIAVSAVGRHDLLAKQFNKALDRRHKAVINDFAPARSAETLRTLWDDAVRRGDIPGAYWAVLTHPAVSEALVKRVFGDVHMLSHLVGAANRADIRQLRQLEDEKAVLEEKVARQQQHLNDAIAARDAKIRDLNAALSARLASEASASPPAAEAGSDAETLARLAADLRRQLDAEAERRQRLERKLTEAAAQRGRDEHTRLRLEDELTHARDELDSVEARLAAWLDGDDDPATGKLDLADLTILYVGGRTRTAAQLRVLVERAGGRLLHHDGGVDEKTDLLPGLVSRADAAFLPVDCVSHEAATLLKRLCRQADKPFTPLRSSSLTSLLHALRSSELNLLRA